MLWNKVTIAEHRRVLREWYTTIVLTCMGLGTTILFFTYIVFIE